VNRARPTRATAGPTRRQSLARLAALLAVFGAGAAAARSAPGKFERVSLGDVRRIDAGGSEGWLARDGRGRLWQVLDDGKTRLLGEGLAPDGPLDAGHGRIAGLGRDGRLWVRSDGAAQPEPQRSVVEPAPQGGLCGLPLAVIGLVTTAGRTVVARFEPDARGPWQVVAQSDEAVLPDAVPVVADLDRTGDGGHVAVLAGPDRQRYPHAVLGDDVEATRVLWLDRHTLRPLRTLRLDEPDVFEDRHLRPWRLPDGRSALVTVRSGPMGAQMAVVAASRRDASALEIAAAGPFIGTRNRWLSPASVDPADADLYAVHTPHIGGVLQRYRAAAGGLHAERVASGLTNHRIGTRDLDSTARLGRWLLVPMQDWQRMAIVDLETVSVAHVVEFEAPILQLVTSPSRRRVGVLTPSGLSLFRPR
jgi:hypothetical protein